MSYNQQVFYQAVCDICGQGYEGDEYSFFDSESAALDEATGWGHDWVEVEAGDIAYLICDDHGSVLSCRTCGDDIPEDGWQITGDGMKIGAKCENGHRTSLGLSDRHHPNQPALVEAVTP